MTTETPKPQPWPLDTTEGARMILEAAAALMAGQACVAYLRPAMDGFKLMAKELLDDAEVLAASAMARSKARGAGAGMESLFRQRPQGVNQLSSGLHQKGPHDAR